MLTVPTCMTPRGISRPEGPGSCGKSCLNFGLEPGSDPSRAEGAILLYCIPRTWLQVGGHQEEKGGTLGQDQ